MAGYINSKSRIARRSDESAFGTGKVLAKGSSPPGQHSNNRRHKVSGYGAQLVEEQKARYTYDVLERQFRNLSDKAVKTEGITDEVLLQSLEGRLGNIVFRLGITPTRAATRQLISHGHIVVNGNVIDITSYQVKADDIVGVHGKAKSLEVIETALASFSHSKYPWLEWDDGTKCGKLLHRPDRTDIPESIKEQLIVELYSKQ